MANYADEAAPTTDLTLKEEVFSGMWAAMSGLD
jgi:hypothetical protein